MFKLWSETNPSVEKELKIDFGMRSWNELELRDKGNIWKHLEYFLFAERDRKRSYYGDGREYELNYEFFGQDEEKIQKIKRILKTINYFKENYKARNLTPNFLNQASCNAACVDFQNLFIHGDENVFLELISAYTKALIQEELGYVYKQTDETEENFEMRKKEIQKRKFLIFATEINDTFSQFGIYVHLTELGFVPRQEEKIQKEIYEPALKKLAHTKWLAVNEELKSAFQDFLNKDYSGCITKSIAAVQAFLQILVTGNIGKGHIVDLLAEGIKKEIIPSDVFSREILKKIESCLAQERQEKGDAHPKQTHAQEKDARLVLNIVMIFIEHCL